MVERMSPDIIASPTAIDRTADMIHQFSLAALMRLGESTEDRS
jgi:hypothetical protein